jgi:hypothetical protein
MGAPLYQMATSVVERIEGFGVTVPFDSRFALYARLFGEQAKADRGPISVESPDFPVAAQGMLDVMMMDFIFGKLADQLETATLQAALHRVVAGPAVEQLEAPYCSARDFQFELLAAARCCWQGSGVRLAEPDVIAHLEGKPLAVACKRIKSYDKLEERIRAARRQILACELPGVICLDVSVMFNDQPMQLIGPIDERAFGSRLSAAFKAFSDQHIKLIEDHWVGQTTWIRGIILVYHAPRGQADQPVEMSTTAYCLPLCRTNAARKREFLKFVESFGATAPGISSSLPSPSVAETNAARSHFNRSGMQQFTKSRRLRNSAEKLPE